MLDSNLNLIRRHRAAHPGSFFVSVDGERCSDREEVRLWDMLWRVVKARHTPIMKNESFDIWGEFRQVPDLVTPREYAKSALRRLASWYRVRSSPHTSFAQVRDHA